MVKQNSLLLFEAMQKASQKERLEQLLQKAKKTGEYTSESGLPNLILEKPAWFDSWVNWFEEKLNAIKNWSFPNGKKPEPIAWDFDFILFCKILAGICALLAVVYFIWKWSQRQASQSNKKSSYIPRASYRKQLKTSFLKDFAMGAWGQAARKAWLYFLDKQALPKSTTPFDFDQNKQDKQYEHYYPLMFQSNTAHTQSDLSLFLDRLGLGQELQTDIKEGVADHEK